MIYAPISVFTADQRGGGTILGLLWFVLLVGICGLAVDSTNGFRARTMLQATADATSLAAAIDLPNPGAALSTAVDFAAGNMGAETNGTVLDTADVHIGLWNPVNYTLDTGASFPDAVMVTVRQTEENSNPVPVNFLRIIGLMNWNVVAQAVAQRFIPECLRDGLVARGIVDISSNNDFVRRICVHGQQGVHMQNHNYHELGVTVSMPKLNMLTIPTGGMESNPGLPEALRENILDPRMVNHIHETMAAMVAETIPPSPDLPGYITNFDVEDVDEKFDLSTAEAGRIYHVLCAPNKNVKIPANSTVADVVIIAECEVHIAAGATVTSAVIGSLSGGNGNISKANINVAANVQLGEPDNCAIGGGVQLYSNATIHTAASTAIDGVQMVAKGDIELGARDEGINGISAQSGGNIMLTSNNQFGLCSGGAPDLFTVPYYRLVL
jgi:Flp pilus assembly protein TadG